MSSVLPSVAAFALRRGRQAEREHIGVEGGSLESYSCMQFVSFFRTIRVERIWFSWPHVTHHIFLEVLVAVWQAVF